MANDTELIKSFIWSKTQTNLSKLLKEYPLPQIVRVVDGFCSKNEDTILYDEQILALHEIHSVRKLIGTDSSDTQVAVALSCPTQVLVCPSKCKYIACKVESFQSIFPNIQYVRVKNFGPQSRNANNESTFKVGDIIQIQNIDRKKKSVLCQNTDTKEDMTLSYNSPAIFTPLLNCQKYTLSEVVTNYGLPSRVCLVSTGSQAAQNSDQWNSALTGLTEVVFHKVETEVKVIATTVGGGVGELTHCIGLPTDLPISCTVAKRLTKNCESYEDFLQTLHAGFDSKNLSERVNVFQEISRVKIQDYSNSMTVSRPQLPDTLPSLVRSTAPRNQHHVSPKPKKRTITFNLPQSPKDSNYPLTDPKQCSRSPPEDSTTTTKVNDELSRNHPEDRAITAEDTYIKMGRTEKNDYKCNRPKTHSLHSNSYEEVKPPAWNSNFNQEFAANPSSLPNKQLSESHSDYVIPMISPNVKPQTRKFGVHKRTDARNKSTDSHGNVKCKMDMKHVYEEVNPKLEWDSDSRKFRRSTNCKSQTASNLRSEKPLEKKFAAIITTDDNYDIRSIQILAKYV
ncbi:Hypothetical predicted protein [Paramuricea clavata]|uniref:Uncharacterized protein n=1 Tax=Paramuricea clavata TaxID=317549 RepID=A0A7D9DJ18_PARCT|nr:Hypothetical predicted protein [Paramuricea clavata]